jgi:uncharacterized membrane protein required for colicin V production
MPSSWPWARIAGTPAHLTRGARYEGAGLLASHPRAVVRGCAVRLPRLAWRCYPSGVANLLGVEMDLESFLKSLTAADLALLLIYAGAFVLGFFQGGTRGLLGLLAWLFAFVIGVTVWDPLGVWLSGSWTMYSLAYTQMLAFLIGFTVSLVVGAILIVNFTKRSALLPRWPLADEILGGVLFVVLAVLITAAVLMAFDTAYPLGVEGREDVPWLTSIYEGLSGSAIGGWLNATIVPLLLTVFGPIIPDAFEQLATGSA